VKGFRSRQKDLEEFFMTQGELSACKNVEGLMAAVNIRHNPEEWRPFIDFSMHSLKAVLLHKTNVLPSTPLAYAIHKQEAYENIKENPNYVKYKTYQLHIGGDL
jgi:hypothetical protein